MSICQRCKTVFTCGMTDAPGSNKACWCAGLPPLPRDAYPANDAGSCLCAQCLRKLIAESGQPKADPEL